MALCSLLGPIELYAAVISPDMCERNWTVALAIPSIGVEAIDCPRLPVPDMTGHCTRETILQ